MGLYYRQCNLGESGVGLLRNYEVLPIVLQLFNRILDVGQGLMA